MTDSYIHVSISAFLSELRGVKRYSDNTVNAYRRDLEQFLNFCESKNISDPSKVSEKNIRLFIMELNDSEVKLTKSSISRKLSAIRGFFDYLVKNEIIESNPVKNIPNPKSSRKLPETINVDYFSEIYRFIDEENNPDKAKLLKAIFELLYGCALRVSELCNLNIRDVDFGVNSMRILGKGAKVRIVPIADKSLEVLRDYLNTRGSRPAPDEPLFFTPTGNRIYPRFVQHVVKKYIGKVSDISKKSPHVLRHSAATHMLDNGADLMAVKEILGHENLSTTQIYTHVSVERLKQSYKKAHPKS